MKQKDRFHEILSSRRRELGLTQEQLAQRMNVSAQAVSKWEKNSFPDAAVLPRLAEALNISLDTLFGLHDPSGQQDPEAVISRIFRSIAPEQRTALFMRMLYTAVCTYDPSWEEISRLPDRFACETFASLKTDDALLLMRLNPDLRYACFLEVPENGIGAYLGDTIQLRRLFRTLSDDEALRIIAHLGSGARNKMFSVAGIAQTLEIPSEHVQEILNRLERFGLVWRMKAEFDDGHRIVYGNTHKTPLTMLLILAKTITNYIRNINPDTDIWQHGVFRGGDAGELEPIPFWEDNEL
ncbi:MAG: transcriptional regulator [Oscillospiraceae bacterium]|nr:transcriptional regulator [Oscillospiraceae bacterium]